jgi:mannose-1-phosphate guanylyltransferase/mannose-6-phosphate isomerase
MEDTVVVDTPDALLVCPRASSGKVRDIVRNLNDKHDERALFHQTVFCPWDTLYHYGEFPDLQDQEYGHLPGKSLSLQLHHHRGEHWVVVTGMTCV